jgi:hypothetical protein
LIKSLPKTWKEAELANFLGELGFYDIFKFPPSLIPDNRLGKKNSGG